MLAIITSFVISILMIKTTIASDAAADVIQQQQEEYGDNNNNNDVVSLSIFHNCTMTCGWIAAIISVLSFGSFGVPIRHCGHNAHPMIMQSYKTFMCFITCWFIILLGEKITFTYWGILSGIFWVPGATCGIYGIRYAGLAVAVGTWSSIIVITSFLFGIIVFKESVHSFIGALFAFITLMIGLIGMSRYSAKPISNENNNNNHKIMSSIELISTINSENNATIMTTPTKTSIRKKKLIIAQSNSINMQEMGTTNGLNGIDNQDVRNDDSNDSSTVPLLTSSLETKKVDEMVDIIIDDDDENDHNDSNKPNIVLFNGRISLTRRQLGILGAIFNGSWGGMNLIPLHYARKQNEHLTGAGYIISYACGSMIIQILLWILLYLYYLIYKTTVNKNTDHHYYERIIDAYEMLPKFRNDLIGPGILCGLLYSIGNFGSIIAVSYLGQGTGFSFCQMTLLVSGLWGIFYFKEITDIEYIYKWFISALIAIIGIIWLSYEHASGVKGH